MAGDFPNRQGYAGVTSQFPASGWARAELALNQDKSRLQLRRSGSPVNQARSFKFTACAVSDAPGALSPRSAAIVPGRRSTSPVLRGLKVGEIISVLRDRSPDGSGPGASESMVWPHRRGDENMIAANGFQLGRVERRARSASPPARGRRGDMEEARMVAMFAAVSTEQEVEVDVLNLGASVGGRDGRTRPLSPRVRESDWLDGLSSRMPERGGSRLFPTHLAKSAKFTGGPKTGGAFVVSGGAKVTGSAGSGTQRSPKAAAKKAPPSPVAPKKVARDPRTSKAAIHSVEKIAGDKTAEVSRAQRGSREAKSENDAGARKVEKLQSNPPAVPMSVPPVSKETSLSERADSKEVSKQGLSKLQLLRKRLEDTMRAAEGIVPKAPAVPDSGGAAGGAVD